jgi:hypothetical protein
MEAVYEHRSDSAEQIAHFISAQNDKHTALRIANIAYGDGKQLAQLF